mgnify:CR=1 FL=1
MVSKNKVYVFRHGQTYYNHNKYFTGWKDSKLTPKGIKNAESLAKQLKDKQIDVAFYTSLSRSKDTLNVVLKYHPECKKKLIDDRIIERDYGDLAGKKHSTIIKKYGKKQFEKWHRGYSTPPPNGECFADVEKRVKDFVKYLKEFVKENKVNVAISAHGNSIRVLRKIMEGLSVKETETIEIPYDKVFVYLI